MWHFDTAFRFRFSFYINENVDTVNGYKHRINSSIQVFLQYICNWCEEMTSCADPHNGFSDEMDTYFCIVLHVVNFLGCTARKS